MRTEYRIIFTATFDTLEEREKMYGSLKTQVLDTISKSGIAKRADMTRDEYLVNEAPATERVI
jgi:hypothetical protein